MRIEREKFNIVARETRKVIACACCDLCAKFVVISFFFCLESAHVYLDECQNSVKVAEIYMCCVCVFMASHTSQLPNKMPIFVCIRPSLSLSLYIYIYIYMCVCVCVCVCARARVRVSLGAPIRSPA